MSKTIAITLREVYGTALVYPACQDAVRFAEIAGSKTLTPQTLRLIEALGYEIIHTPVTLRRAA